MPASLLAYAALVLQALRFWSRLPVPVLSFEVDPYAPPNMASLAPALPVAGALIGFVGGLVLLLASALGLPAWPTAILASAALVIATGAMHEDGLGDIADGFGGGRTIERKLEIMKDPRVGAYGASALMLALAFRIATLAALIEAAGPFRAALMVIAAAALSRICGLWPLVMLAPARIDGLGAAAGTLDMLTWRRGAAVGAAIALVVGLLAAGPAAIPALLLGFAASVAVAMLAERQIGGQTGDVCGAATLLAELAFLAGLLAVGHGSTI